MKPISSAVLGISASNVPEIVKVSGLPGMTGSGKIFTVSTGGVTPFTGSHGPKVVSLLRSLCGIAYTMESVANKMNTKIKFRFMISL